MAWLNGFRRAAAGSAELELRLSFDPSRLSRSSLVASSSSGSSGVSADWPANRLAKPSSASAFASASTSGFCGCAGRPSAARSTLRPASAAPQRVSPPSSDQWRQQSAAARPASRTEASHRLHPSPVVRLPRAPTGRPDRAAAMDRARCRAPRPSLFRQARYCRSRQPPAFVTGCAAPLPPLVLDGLVTSAIVARGSIDRLGLALLGVDIGKAGVAVVPTSRGVSGALVAALGRASTVGDLSNRSGKRP